MRRKDESIGRTGPRGKLLALALLMLMVAACGRLAERGPAADGDERSAAGGGNPGRWGPGSTGDPGAPPDDSTSDQICVEESPPDDADPDTPVAGCPDDGGDVPIPKSSPVTPRPGMADVRAIGWDRVDVAGDGRALTIHFWSGVEPCSVLDRVDVRYGNDAVTITLYEGHDPSADGKDVACIEIAVAKSVTITLDEPLAGRELVDGAEV
jgi:hypothetical protein